MNSALLRGGAIVIAILGVIDPAITTERRSRPEVAVVSDAAIDGELADRVADALADDFTVVRGAYPNAAATVLVGTAVPQTLLESQMPAVAVVPEGDTGVRIEGVHAPRTTTRDARAVVNAVVHARGAAGRTLEITLGEGGFVLDRVEHTVNGNDERVVVPLTFVPAAAGSVVLRVSAHFHGDEVQAAADVAIDVRDARYAVLFFDPRPSWQSTFVRRAIADDPRFIVTSRVVTSRGISTDAGRPPAALTDIAALAGFDAIVIGAPELLTDAEVRALDTFMRRRGGTVTLLLDHAARGPYERLAGVQRWSSVRRGRFAIRAASGAVAAADSAALQAPDTAALLASEVVWPARLPAGAAAVATADDAEPVVWRSAAGAGRLVVSGALDAWRFRDRPAFAAFWRRLLAVPAPPAIEVDVPAAPLAAGAAADVLVTLRDAALANETPGRGVTTSISVTFETTAGKTSVKVWPAGAAGRFRGAIHAPREPGVYGLSVSAGGARTTAFVPVVAAVQHARPDASRGLTAWAVSRGGRVFDAAQLDDAAREVARLAKPQTRTVTWYPMRSALWIVPFALLLGIDWWLRRHLTSHAAASTLNDERAGSTS